MRWYYWNIGGRTRLVLLLQANAVQLIDLHGGSRLNRVLETLRMQPLQRLDTSAFVRLEEDVKRGLCYFAT